MIIDIPTNHVSFQLSVTVKSNYPIRIRVVVLDPSKPATKYLDIQGNVDGLRTFEIKMPTSPKRTYIHIFNVDEGDLPIGEDASFVIEDTKVEKLKEYDVWWNDDTRNFYKFAVEFSKNAGIISSGKMKPHIYRSDDGKFTIDYYDTIYDKESKQFLSTPARIGHNSGIIEVSKRKFLEYTVPMRLIILMHEFAHKYLNPNINKPISDETSADIQGLYVYLGKGWSPIEANKAFLRVFREANGKANHKRYKILKDFIEKYDRGEIEDLKK